LLCGKGSARRAQNSPSGPEHRGKEGSEEGGEEEGEEGGEEESEDSEEDVPLAQLKRKVARV
jgi:hypothetical protein